ncbi:MAG: ATP-binding protein [Bacteroidales bacterium]
MVQISRQLIVASVLATGVLINCGNEAKASDHNKLSPRNKIDSLITLSYKLNQSEPQEAIRAAKEAIRLSQENGEILQVAKSRLSLAATYRQQRDFIRVLKTLNPLLENLTELNNDTLANEILANIGIAHFQLGHDNLSLNTFIKEFDRKESDQEVETLSKSLKSIGKFYLNTKHYDRAADFFRKSISVDSMANDNAGVGKSNFYLGKTAFMKNDTAKAIELFKFAIPLLSKTDRCETYTYLAKIFFDIDKSISMKYIDMAKHLLSSDDESTYQHELMILQGKILAAGDDFDNAMLSFRKAENLAGENEEELARGYLFIAKRMLNKNKVDNAYECFLKAYNTAGTIYKLKSEAILGMARIFSLQGRKDEANKKLWEYVNLSDSSLAEVINENRDDLKNPLSSINLERKIDLYQKDTKIQSLILEREKAKKRHFIILVSVLVPLLFFILVLYRERTISNKKLTDQNRQINQQIEELSAINEQLNLSREQLQKANSTKDKLFSIIAHDLKSPLVSLRTLLFSLTSNTENVTNEQNNQLRYIESTLNTIIELLNNLLFWAMSQKDETSLNPEEFDVKEAVETELKLAKNIARQKSIVIRTEIPDNLTVSTDKNMLLFVLRNLLSNAIKFTPANGTIAVSFFEDNGYLTLRVKDTGVGIASEMQGSIFDVVSSGKEERKEGEGTGLGLTLCSEFAKKMGGTLAVKSEVNKGSLFSLTIPAKL